MDWPWVWQAPESSKKQGELENTDSPITLFIKVIDDDGDGDLFVIVLRHSNSISVISWQWHDVGDEEKTRAYIFTDLRDL